MSELDEFRTMKDEAFRDPQQSPLEPDQLETFNGLSYYPENPDLDILAELEPVEEDEPVTLITSKGSVQQFYRVGKLRFAVDGARQVLTLFQDAEGSYLFLPFTDATSGTETYGAGRYVEVEPHGMHGDRHMIRVNFNLAYNPYCAYNEMWVCPIPPTENRLSAPIRAGEKTFHL